VAVANVVAAQNRDGKGAVRVAAKEALRSGGGVTLDADSHADSHPDKPPSPTAAASVAPVAEGVAKEPDPALHLLRRGVVRVGDGSREVGAVLAEEVEVAFRAPLRR
jgi:hypothetical protein